MPTPEYCFLSINWWPLCMTKAEWSGWVQAIFSVVAIASAFMISEVQQTRSKRASNEQQWEMRLALTRACYLVCDEAVQTMGFIARKLRERLGQRYRLRSERVEDLLATFQTLLGKDVPPEVLRDVLAIQRELSYTQIALIQLQKAHEVTLDRMLNAEKRAASVSASLGNLRKRHNVYQWVVSAEGEKVLAQPLSFEEMEYFD